MSANGKQTMNFVTANGGDCSAARTSSAFLRVLGIAAAVSFLFFLVILVGRLGLGGLILGVLILGLLGIVRILRGKENGKE